MFEFKRNQVIVIACVLTIAITAFLMLEDGKGGLEYPNYATETVDVAMEDVDFTDDFFNEFNEMTTLPPDDVEEELALETVGQQVIIAKKEPTTSVVEQKAVEVSYFAEEKMLREQSRAAQIEQLTEYVADQNLDADTKAKAAENLLLIQDRIEKESSAESLLRAKGFKDVFVRMDSQTVDVVINASTLTDEQVAQIEEIVQRKTGYTVGQVKIAFLSMDKETAQK